MRKFTDPEKYHELQDQNSFYFRRSQLISKEDKTAIEEAIDHIKKVVGKTKPRKTSQTYEEADFQLFNILIKTSIVSSENKEAISFNYPLRPKFTQVECLQLYFIYIDYLQKENKTPFIQTYTKISTIIKNYSKNLEEAFFFTTPEIFDIKEEVMFLKNAQEEEPQNTIKVILTNMGDIFPQQFTIKYGTQSLISKSEDFFMKSFLEKPNKFRFIDHFLQFFATPRILFNFNKEKRNPFSSVEEKAIKNFIKERYKCFIEHPDLIEAKLKTSGYSLITKTKKDTAVWISTLIPAIKLIIFQGGLPIPQVSSNRPGFSAFYQASHQQLMAFVFVPINAFKHIEIDEKTLLTREKTDIASFYKENIKDFRYFFSLIMHFSSWDAVYSHWKKRESHLQFPSPFNFTKVERLVFFPKMTLRKDVISRKQGDPKTHLKIIIDSIQPYIRNSFIRFAPTHEKYAGYSDSNKISHAALQTHQENWFFSEKEKRSSFEHNPKEPFFFCDNLENFEANHEEWIQIVEKGSIEEQQEYVESSFNKGKVVLNPGYKGPIKTRTFWWFREDNLMVKCWSPKPTIKVQLLFFLLVNLFNFYISA